MSTQQARRTAQPLSSAALAIGVVAILSFFIGWIVLAWMMPGNIAMIGVITALAYVLPIAGVVVGHVARRREDRSRAATIGLVLSYVALALTIMPLVIDLVVRIAELA